MKQIRETSVGVIEEMLYMINDIEWSFEETIMILEPSCGDGKIVSHALTNKLSDYYSYHFDCVELNETRLNNARTNLKQLEDDGAATFNFYQADFLKWAKENETKYDLILACPPFKNNIDLEHIKTMFGKLKTGFGQLVTLTSPYWVTNNETHQVEFREWLCDKTYEFRMLPDNSFMEKGKNVPTGILNIKW